MQGRFAPYELVCDIGSRPGRLHVVRQPGHVGRSKFLVAELFAGAMGPAEPCGPNFVAEARRISTLASPNVARVREMSVREEDLVVFWEFIDGENLASLWLSPALRLEVALRWILDVLSGVGAIHTLRDTKQKPMLLAHGEVSPSTVVVGVDGIARVMHSISRRVAGATTEVASAPYLAPEVRAGAAYDMRADVFGVGALLWEALSGRSLLQGGRPSMEGAEPPAVLDEAPWTKPLGEVACRALAASPDDRWSTAAVMAAEIRKAAGLRLASAATAVSFANEAVGDRARARRERLDAIDPEVAPRALEAPYTVPALKAAPSSPSARRWEDDDTSVQLVPESMPPSASIIPESLPPAGPAAEIAFAPPAVPPPPMDLLREAAGSPPAMPATAVDVPPVTASPPEPLARVAIEPAAFNPSQPLATPWAALSPIDSAEVVARASSLPPVSPALRRRRIVVLGSVGALGLFVFAIAGLRNLSHGRTALADDGVHPLAAETAKTPGEAEGDPGAAAAPGSATAAAMPAPSPSPAVDAPVPPLTPTAAPASHRGHAANPSPKPATHKAAGAGQHAKPRPKSGFDPNSL